ncbi:hypothetical protein D934_05995 [Xylella fastidiosa subsp. sandyi Ann-1]|uniref:Uncharacterized protein n=1 Tax=Xylella fastidiosa subsp. sandyi Ann-1 TaxID=155920 RepID=A0A060H334_XYLFS|nr:hypothetical protein D934_05995 [Xylella fastidiosa subsp. sandyi Ann-1]
MWLIIPFYTPPDTESHPEITKRIHACIRDDSAYNRI